VANGCDSQEIDQLKDIINNSTRTQLLIFPGRKVSEHSIVLNFLQLMDRDREYFCFVDSDIFATNWFLNEFANLDKNSIGVFSGSPIWVKKSEYVFPNNFDVIGGYYHYINNNVCLGATFFSIYNNHVLSKVIKETGIGFQGYLQEDIPKDIYLKLKTSNLLRYSYDTGKLLNIVLQLRGHKITYKDNENLIHIGGIGVKSLTPEAITLKKKVLFSVVGKRFGIKLLTSFKRKFLFGVPSIRNKSEKSFQIEQVIRRDLIRNYMAQLFKAIEGNYKPPQIPKIKDPEILQNLISASSELRLIYKANRNL